MFDGLCSGAKSEQDLISFNISSLIITESENFSQPWTTLCQTASISFIFQIIALSHFVNNINASFIASL